MHVLLVEYIETLFVANDCFEGDPTQDEDPNFKEIVDKYKKRIPLINNCYHNLTEEGFMKHCWFLCHSYNINKISTFYDGEIDFLRNVYLHLYSFVRKYNFRKNYAKQMGKEPNIGIGKSELLEPLTAASTISQKFYLDDETRSEILNSLNTLPKFNKFQIEQMRNFLKATNNHSGLIAIDNYEKLLEADKKKNKDYYDLLKKIKEEALLEYYEKYDIKPPKKSIQYIHPGLMPLRKLHQERQLRKKKRKLKKKSKSKQKRKLN